MWIHCNNFSSKSKLAVHIWYEQGHIVATCWIALLHYEQCVHFVKTNFIFKFSMWLATFHHRHHCVIQKASMFFSSYRISFGFWILTNILIFISLRYAAYTCILTGLCMCTAIVIKHCLRAPLELIIPFSTEHKLVMHYNISFWLVLTTGKYWFTPLPYFLIHCLNSSLPVIYMHQPVCARVSLFYLSNLSIRNSTQ